MVRRLEFRFYVLKKIHSEIDAFVGWQKTNSKRILHEISNTQSVELIDGSSSMFAFLKHYIYYLSERITLAI